MVIGDLLKIRIIIINEMHKNLFVSKYIDVLIVFRSIYENSSKYDVSRLRNEPVRRSGYIWADADDAGQLPVLNHTNALYLNSSECSTRNRNSTNYRF